MTVGTRCTRYRRGGFKFRGPDYQGVVLPWASTLILIRPFRMAALIGPLDTSETSYPHIVR